MNDELKRILALSSESAALDREITEKQLEIQKMIMRISGLISLYRIKKGHDPSSEIIQLRDRLFREYMRK
ncbi:hypothetical protein [Thermoplasma sp.]|uniref:hypothetical protein n=1 Tax=Thermoplasma sp. TaxID=1973142 RepID=UPI00262FEB1D|nr:hypothetical protein [Thermoplasma sp.]